MKTDTNVKEISQETLRKIFRNLVQAIIIMIYFAILNFVYSKLDEKMVVSVIEICSGILMITGLIYLEKSYKTDNGTFAITGIEFLLLAFHSLSITHVIAMYEYQFQFYLLTSSYVVAIYYVFKSIFLYTKAKRDYLKGLSDIPEIVKKDEPTKKEAKKRNEKEEAEIKTEDIKPEKKGKKEENTRKKQKNARKENEKTNSKKEKNKKEEK